MDSGLIDAFNNNIDIYVFSAKLYLGGEEAWEKLSGKDKKMWRKRFKTIFLGVLYGLGKQNLAARLECSIQEAENIIQGLYKSFPRLREYVDEQAQYPLDNDGYVNTMLGDKLQLPEFTEYLPKAKDDKERNNVIARIRRLGVNLPIQGGTSSIMQHGFFNNIRASIETGWDRILQPLITVHDSNTNYFGAEYLWDIIPFYTKHYTNHCATVGPKIFLLWDLNSGTAYEKACATKQVDKDIIEYTGSSDQVIEIYDKLMRINKFKVECDKTREEILSAAQYVDNPIKRFILEGGASMIKDLSRITVRFKRVK